MADVALHQIFKLVGGMPALILGKLKMLVKTKFVGVFFRVLEIFFSADTAKFLERVCHYFLCSKTNWFQIFCI